MFVRGSQKKAARRIWHLKDLDCEEGRLLNRDEKTEGILSITWNVQAASAKSNRMNIQWRQRRNHWFKLQQQRLILIRKKSWRKWEISTCKLSRTSYAATHHKCSVSAHPFKAKDLSRSFPAILPDFYDEIQTDADLTGEVSNWRKIHLKTSEDCSPLLLCLRRLKVPGTVSDYKKQRNMEAKIKTFAYMISVKTLRSWKQNLLSFLLGLLQSWKMYKYL